jgi:hypothetical protein
VGTRGRPKLSPKGRRKPAARLRSLTCGVEVPADPITRKSVSVVHASDEGRDHAVRRAPSGRRIALLVCLALLGLTTTYAFVGGSQALAGTPTGPNPDPPPPPIRHPQPPPPPPPPPPPCRRISLRRLASGAAREGAEAKSRAKTAPAGAAPVPEACAGPQGTLVLQPERPGRSEILGPRSCGSPRAGPSRRRLRPVLPRADDRRLGARGRARSRASAGLTATSPRRSRRPAELLFFVALAVDAAVGFVLLVYVLAAG